MARIFIRLAEPGDVPAIGAIDMDAGARFAGTGLIATANGLPEPIPHAAFAAAIAARWLFLAIEDGRALGFAMGRVEGRDLLLEQISVTLAAGRRGLGAALLRHMLAQARRRGCAAIVLTTFRHVAWNGPFYRRHGFREIPEAAFTPWQRAIFDGHSEIMPASGRCFMRRRLLAIPTFRTA